MSVSTVWIEGLEDRKLLAATDVLLHSFAGRPADGSVPMTGLTMVGSKLYGVTQFGGSHDDGSGGGPGLGHKGGTIYSVNTDGSGYQVLHEFGGNIFGVIPDGYEPLAGLTEFNGKLYGTTPFGGPGTLGVVYSINLDGSGYQLVHAFGAQDPLQKYDEGGSPFYAPLVPVNGKLYGIATVGGRPLLSGGGNGVLFSIDPSGSNYTKVHVFDFETGVGIYDLPIVTNGTTFYGIQSSGGPANAGRIYSIGVDGSDFKVLHVLNGGSDGSGPMNGLTLATDNTLAGVTLTNGAVGQGTLFTMNTDGTNFQTRQSFSTLVNGGFPHGELLKVGDKLYGTTSLGGTGFPTISPVGSVFSTNLDGTGLQTVYSFNGLVVGGKKDGASPYGRLVTDGTKIYGASGGGGVNGVGIVFSVPLNSSGGTSGGGALADLTVKISGKAPGKALAGTTKGSLTLTVSNKGKAKSSVVRTSVRLLLSKDATPDSGDVVLGTYRVAGALKVGGSKSVAASFKVPKNTASGRYRVLAVVDPDGTVAEGNEGNNVATASGSISVAAPVVNLAGSFSRVAAKAGKKSTLSLVLKNTGTVGAKKLHVPLRVVMSRDGVFDGVGETVLANVTKVVTVAAGGKVTVPVGLAALGAPKGAFAVQVLIDPDEVTGDGKVGDNVVKGSLRVT